MPKNKRLKHPFLLTINGRDFFHKDSKPSIGSDNVFMTEHHLYPKNRKDVLLPEDVLLPKNKFMLKIWCYKHFKGWNSLFQFFYLENNEKIHSELTIDEIITLMRDRHWFIIRNINTEAWKIVFKDNDIEQAIKLLCRFLRWKFNKEPTRVYNSKIESALIKTAA